MNVIRTLLVAGAAVVAISTGASAATIDTAVAQCDTAAPIAQLPGANAFNCGTEPRRLSVGNVNLGAGDGSFFSLGLARNGNPFGGGAAFEISPAFTGPAMTVEVTNGRTNHFEAADIFVGNSLDDLIAKAVAGMSVGRVDNGMGGRVASRTTVTFDGIYTWIGFRDVSLDYASRASGNASQDGFDLDSFSVSEAAPVPLPAGGLLLLSGLGGIAAWRKRRA